MRPVLYILQGNVRVTGPHPTPKQTIMMMKEKGPQSRGLRAPRSSLVTYAFTAACKTSKDRPDQQKPKDRTQGQRPKTIQKPRETRPGATIPTSDGDEKKKQGREPHLGVRAELEVRVEVGERVQEEENTRGNPNQKGLDFPSA